MMRTLLKAGIPILSLLGQAVAGTVELTLDFATGSDVAAELAKVGFAPLKDGRSFAFTTRWDDTHQNGPAVARVLREHGMPGTFYHVYVAQGLIDGILGPQQEIGSHTSTHRSVGMCSGNTSFLEMMGNRCDLECAAQRPVLSFVLPGCVWWDPFWTGSGPKLLGECIRRVGFTSSPEFAGDKLRANYGFATNEFVVSHLFCPDDRKNWPEKFEAYVANALDQIAQGKLREPIITQGVHPWLDAEGFRNLHTNLTSIARHTNAWFCTQSEYAAYRRQFFDARIRERRLTAPGRAVVTLELPPRGVWGAEVPLTVLLPSSVTAVDGSAVTNGAFNVSLPGPSHVPAKIDQVVNADNSAGEPMAAGRLPLAARLTIDVTQNVARLTVSNLASGTLRLTPQLRLPPHWRTGVVGLAACELAPATTHTWTSELGMLDSRAELVGGKILAAAEIEVFDEENRCSRLWARTSFVLPKAYPDRGELPIYFSGTTTNAVHLITLSESGDYRLWADCGKAGFTSVRVNGETVNLTPHRVSAPVRLQAGENRIELGCRLGKDGKTWYALAVTRPKGDPRFDFLELSSEGAKNAAAVNARATAERLMSVWTKALLDLQDERPGFPELDGGVLCPACAAMHGRTIDAVWPLCWQWQQTGDARYLKAAKRLVRWSRFNLERPDGAYFNDPNMGWRGTTVFSLTALGRVLERWGDKLDADTKEEWLSVFRRQADWCRQWMDDSGLVVNVNYRGGYALAMEIAYRVLKDEKYRVSGDAQAKRCLGCIAADGLLYGEAKPLEYISPRGLRGVDIGYNVEETLPALLEWAELRGDAESLAKLLDCAETHLWLLLPDGGVDNSFGSRAYKWTYWGSRTSDGILPMLTILARHNRKGARTAAERTLALYARCTTAGGLLAGGVGYVDAAEPTCIHHTFCHLKTLPFYLEEPLPSSGDDPLPGDTSFGIKRFPTCGATLVGIGAWRASFSENDVYFVEDNGKSTGGGSLTLLYHRKLGPLFAASMPAWSVVERMSMQEQTKDDVTRCLTPRLVCGDFMSVYDDAVDFTVAEASGAVTATAKGTLTDRADRRLENGGFKLVWQVDGDGVTVTAEASTAMTLVLPVLADGESRVEVDGSTATVTRNAGRVKLASNAPLSWTRSVRANGLTFSPQTGFLAAELSLPVVPGESVSVRLTVE